MKQHRTDGVSLSFGLIFLAVVGWWATAQVTDVRLPALGWLAAGALILLGVIGLGTAIRSGRRGNAAGETRAEPLQTGPPDAGPPDAGPPETEPPETEPPTAELPEAELPPEVHADIVRELLANPADRPAVEPVTAPPASVDPDPPPHRP